jgi:hypothetical protein
MFFGLGGKLPIMEFPLKGITYHPNFFMASNINFTYGAIQKMLYVIVR